MKRVSMQSRSYFYKSIILIIKLMSYSPSSHIHNYAPINEQAPKREQWALINNYKALQFQKMKQMERAAEIQKKRKLKQALDYQVHNKSDTAIVQKEQDRRYYEYITKNVAEQQKKQDQMKIDKFIKRKHMEQENQYYLEHLRNSRQRDLTPGYNFDIGYQAEMERRRKEQENKKQVLDTLDKQLKIKQQQRKIQRMNDLKQDQNDLKYQSEQFEKRNYRNRIYGQNPKVYEYYRGLQLDRLRKQKQLQHRIVQEGAMQKMQEEDYKRYRKQEEKKHLSNQMKHTLDQQIERNTVQVKQNRKTNPEDVTYQVIGNIFKEKQIPYDKRAYSDYLKMQAEEHAQRRKQERYMSDEEYRINMNQLNKAVSGSYAYDQYIDRSLGSLGETNKINMSQIHEKVQDQDVNTVKHRLDHLKQRTIPIRSHIPSRIF